jgi:hypothetical protein
MGVSQREPPFTSSESAARLELGAGLGRSRESAPPRPRVLGRVRLTPFNMEPAQPAAAQSATEATPLLDPSTASVGGGGPQAAEPGQPPGREKSHRGPFYGALKRTNDVARVLANPWPKARRVERVAGPNAL